MTNSKPANSRKCCCTLGYSQETLTDVLLSSSPSWWNYWALNALEEYSHRFLACPEACVGVGQERLLKRVDVILHMGAEEF